MLKIPVNSFRNTIFARLMVMYLIVILPIILLGLYLYNWSYKNASAEISRNANAQLTAYLEDLNREIEWLEVLQYDIMQESELNKLSVTWELMDNNERRNSINHVIHRLTSVLKSSPYIKDIFVHIRPIGKTVSAENGLYDFDEDRYNDIRIIKDIYGGRLLNFENTLYLSASMYGGLSGKEPLFVVNFELDTEKLRTSLVHVNVLPESGSFLISGENGFTLASDQSSEEVMNLYLTSLSDGVHRYDRNYHFDNVYSDKLGLAVASYLPEETVRRPLSKFTYWAWIFGAASLLAILTFLYSTYHFVHRPLLLLVQGFRRMEYGSLDNRIEHHKQDEFGYLYNRFNHMLDRLQTLIDQDYKQKLMMQKAELKQLQSQINPHFLYNSFFILNSLARTGDTERIELFTNMLGEYFKFITRNSHEHVALADEIKHARMYTEIQKLRFSRRIRVEFDELPQAMERMKVPRLIVQPIIENAYEHSLEKKMSDGLLRVSFAMDLDEALIMVEDNGDALSDEVLEGLQRLLNNYSETDELTGILNIHRRIVLTYGAGSGLSLSRSELNGLRVTIRILLRGGALTVQNANR